MGQMWLLFNDCRIHGSSRSQFEERSIPIIGINSDLVMWQSTTAPLNKRRQWMLIVDAGLNYSKVVFRHNTIITLQGHSCVLNFDDTI